MRSSVCHFFLLLGPIFGQSFRYDATTIWKSPFTSPELLETVLSWPHGVELDSEGNLFVGDMKTSTIFKVIGLEKIAVFIGNGPVGFLDDYGTRAKIGSINSLAIDGNDNLYFLDTVNNRIRQISKSGLVKTVIGDGIKGFRDGPGEQARINDAVAITFSRFDDSLFIFDSNMIRKANASFHVTSIAGTKSVKGLKEGQGLSAILGYSTDLKADMEGNIYFSDTSNHVIWKMNSSGYCSILAGGGSPGYVDGQGKDARFYTPIGLTIYKDGGLLVADSLNNYIRRINLSGYVTTFSGNGLAASFNGLSKDASFNAPRYLIYHNQTGVTYVTEFRSPSLRLIQNSGYVSDLNPSSYIAGIRDGKAHESRFSCPNDIKIDTSGRIMYVTDYRNHAIRIVDLNNYYQVTTISGNGIQGDHIGNLGETEWTYPGRMSILKDGNVLVADNCGIKIFNLSKKTCSYYYQAPGECAAVRKFVAQAIVPTSSDTLFFSDAYYSGWYKLKNGVRDLTFNLLKNGQCVDGDSMKGGIVQVDEAIYLEAEERIYFGDGCNAIRSITLNGSLALVAGSYNQYGTADGSAQIARFRSVSAMSFENNTRLIYFTDPYSYSIRWLSLKNMTVGTLYKGVKGFRDGNLDFAQIGLSFGIAVDADGSIYFADWTNHVIRRLYNGLITTVAGQNAVQFYAAKDNLVFFKRPSSIIKTSNGDFIISDTQNNCLVKLVRGSGNRFEASILSGNGGTGMTNSFTFPFEVQFNQPRGLAYNGSMLFVADSRNNVIRVVDPSSGGSSLYAGNGLVGNSDGKRLNSSFNMPIGIVYVAKSQVFYVTDSKNNMIRMINETSVMTLCGTSERGWKDGSRVSSRFNNPTGITSDNLGNLLVSDTDNHVIRHINPSGNVLVKTIGGNGYPGYRDGNNGESLFYYPSELAVDSNGKIIVIDTFNNAIRSIDLTSNNTISLTWSRNPGYLDGSLENVAKFKYPFGIYVDKENDDSLYIVDSDNNAIRMIVKSFQVTGTGNLNSDNQTLIITVIVFGILAIASTVIIFTYKRSHIKTTQLLKSIGVKKAGSQGSSLEPSQTLSTTAPIAIPGFLLIDNLEKVFRIPDKKEALGKGATGAIVKATIKEPVLIQKYGFHEIAIKLFGTEVSDNDFKYEVLLMSSLPISENLVTFVGYCERPRSIAMRMYGFGLTELLLDKSFSNELKINLKIAIDIAKGMKIVHDKGIIHFDLKPGNILIDIKENNTFVCVICDFGFANFSSDAQRNIVKGVKKPSTNGITIRYAAPELFSSLSVEEGRLSQDIFKKVDVYAYSMILFQVFYRVKPWDTLNQFEIESKVASGLRPQAPNNIQSPIPDFIDDLMKLSWSQKPSERPNFDEILNVIQSKP